MSLKSKIRQAVRAKMLETSTVFTMLPHCASDAPCASCPFLVGNDRELARVAVDLLHPDAPFYRTQRLLRPLMVLVARVWPAKVASWTRSMARVISSGDRNFICHSSVYKLDGSNTTVKPKEQWRLCKGVEQERAWRR